METSGRSELTYALTLANKNLSKMRTNIITAISILLPVGLLSFILPGCERDISELSPAAYPTNPEVFIDGFSAGLNYSAFGGSVPTAFDVDNEITYNNSKASMRIEVPNANDPRGSYAGGTYFTEAPRDLSGYNALTFWAKSSQSASLDVVGFGNDPGESKYQATISGLSLTTGWQKYIIPLPDPSKLTAERGMFFYSTGPVDGKGYSFWIDELKFEKLGTIAHPQYTILNGEDQTENTVIGVSKPIVGLTSIHNLPSGINQIVNAAPAYFEFSTTNSSIATVDASGKVSIIGGPGSAEISAKVGDKTAIGSLKIQSMGAFEHAPTPTRDPSGVISVFSEAYDDVPVDFYNGYWEPFQTTLSADFEVNGDRVLNYTNFNFVGIQISPPQIDGSSMTHLHVDIYLPNTLAANAPFRVEMVDNAGGGTGLWTTTLLASQSEQWISLDIPLSGFTGMTGRTAIWQIIFVDVNGNIPAFYADNIYFYNATPPSAPTTPAPTPTHGASDVIAVYSDAYTVLSGTNLNPGWGQATVFSEIQIQSNNTMKYAGLNYQGIELGSSQDVSGMDFLHLDFWTSNSTSLNVFLISTGPVEKAYSLSVPTSGWTTIDIPLSSFAPVNLADVFQLKFDGNGDIFLDNIYFRKN
jgi:hypothetical protein